MRKKRSNKNKMSPISLKVSRRFAIHNAQYFQRKYPGLTWSQALRMGWKAITL